MRLVFSNPTRDNGRNMEDENELSEEEVIEIDPITLRPDLFKAVVEDDAVS